MLYLRPLLLISLTVLYGCKSPVIEHASSQTYTQAYNTEDHAISIQEKKIFSTQGMQVFASNQFEGARLNDLKQLNDSVFQAIILPENAPINPSPWYAFKVWGPEEKEIILELDYGKYKHRYRPKVSRDGQTWQLLDSIRTTVGTDSTTASINLSIGPDTLWLAGQEVIGSTAVNAWCQRMAAHPAVSFSMAGKSTLGRNIPLLDICSGSKKKKDVIVILSRQHPPEVTGYFAMQYFIQELLEENALARAFRDKYRILVFPLMNPDGVDLGHWRHNAGGIDLNRDWANYRQPETKSVADFIVRETSYNRNRVILGLDFHSTYWDVYYTLDHTAAPSLLPAFTQTWLGQLEMRIEGYHIREEPSGLTRPVSKNWFNAQFGAEGVTYEIGDQTPREFIQRKGSVSATVMMELLMKH